MAKAIAVSVLMVGLATVAAAAAAPKRAVVPFTYEEARLYAKATINGVAVGDVIVDSGTASIVGRRRTGGACGPGRRHGCNSNAALGRASLAVGRGRLARLEMGE